MKFEEVKKYILENPNYNDCFSHRLEEKDEVTEKIIKKDMYLIYYHGQKVFEITNGKIKIVKGIFNISGNTKFKNYDEYVENNFSDGKDNKKTLLDILNPYIEIKINSFNIKHGDNWGKNINIITTKINKFIQKNNKFSEEERLKKYKVSGIKGLINTTKVEHKIITSLTDKNLGIAKPGINKSSYELKIESITKESEIKEICDALNKIVVRHAEHIKGKDEKIFQEYLLTSYLPEINEEIDKYKKENSKWKDINLIALEEELFINREDKNGNEGRIDNLYISKNKQGKYSIIPLEVKYNEKVVCTKVKFKKGKKSTQPGLYKHAKDLSLFLSDKGKQDRLDRKNELQTRLDDVRSFKNRFKEVNEVEFSDNKFIFVCGYTEDEKIKTLEAIKEELNKFVGDTSLDNLDMLLITGLVNKINIYDEKQIRPYMKEIRHFEIKTDRNNIEKLQKELLVLKENDKNTNI